ncbi:cytochrome P450 [Actinomadura terrae]|uniref:cytochrome P450 n=1 Tax=Actinomadura terrae TaxID=604353 RepID=UPI001FA798AE|nr:cytochrome P450 [Actinomadura terrae]
MTVPLYRLLGDLRRGGPLALLNRVSDEAPGSLVRLDLGPFRPYLVSHPDDLKQILRTNKGNYVRGAAMWSALSRLAGNGIGGEGARWATSRAVLEPLFSGSHLNDRLDEMVASIVAGVDDLGERAAAGRPIVSSVEMTRLVQGVINPVFFGGRVPKESGERLGVEISTAMRSLLWRMALPFVPLPVPLPGDRAYRRSTAAVHDLLRPVVTATRREAGESGDVVTRLLASTGPDGAPLTDQQVCDDVVALFIAGSESSAIALTWVWVVLARYPDVAARVVEEIDRVLGGAPPRRDTIRRLTYTQMVLNEVLRIYSVGWAVPRMALRDDVIGGVPVKAGTTLVLSPYLTHRLGSVWERPLEFDPERFTPERVKARHRLAYLPFGAGAHACVGQALFEREAAVILATVLSRYEVEVEGPVEPQVSLTLQPRDPVKLILRRR